MSLLRLSIDMRIMLALVILRSVRALSTIPAAARRLQKIKELETQHASLVASGAMAPQLAALLQAAATEARTAGQRATVDVSRVNGEVGRPAGAS